ncbi:MAG: bifunctional 2-polyprenyl-6-hydroxyphenol methylase/3-demethylubiquinol 3-O-methyltransferase UbiG [Alphaproteobacteria bacterium]|nr:bifunctional 2-polyprenyl-6-hydroxyphenol methylase/3-demethylubiquinol 3-O-methyltransferase UbiG [Alphaproteobacteria bacterium]
MSAVTREPSTAGPSTIDEAEVARFSALAAEWWNPHGKFGVLHKFNPVRLAFIRDEACAHFGRDPKGNRPFAGLRLLDIGCGGGLLSEPMTRLGFEVLGADASEKNIKTAQVHAGEQSLAIDYRATTAEALAAAGEKFDAILNMEVIEHVADLNLFVESCASMLKPSGIMFVATINRTAKAFALAIVGAEYVLGWLPRGTHDWAKFVKPLELDTALTRARLTVGRETGVMFNVMFNPLTGKWLLTSDMDVNYMVVAVK